MHDASEVLGEILNCLHRAEARARAAASPSNSECALYCACSHAKGLEAVERSLLLVKHRRWHQEKGTGTLRGLGQQERLWDESDAFT
eukprot:scaffold72127_cov19-Tisochrysis_lutea.AAC.3